MMSTTFGYLTPFEVSREKTMVGRPVIYWWCRCVCGNKVKRRESDLVGTQKMGRRSSCGCKFSGAAALGPESPHWKGCGQLNNTYYGVIRDRCKRQGKELGVDIKYMWDLYVAQDGRCALTGLPIGFATLRQRLAGVGDNTASLDRINSDVGYVAGNLQWVHKDVNLMKNQFPQERFVDMCKLVATKFSEQPQNSDSPEQATAA